jgi:carboxylesterase type B
MFSSPLVKGLFHKAIIENSSLCMVHPGTPLLDAEALGAWKFARMGVKTLAEARFLDCKTVVKAGMDLEAEMNKMTPTGLCGFAIEGYIFQDSYDKIFGKG